MENMHTDIWVKRVSVGTHGPQVTASCDTKINSKNPCNRILSSIQVVKIQPSLQWDT